MGCTVTISVSILFKVKINYGEKEIVQLPPLNIPACEH